MKSLAQASTLGVDEVEILCSWNGKAEDEQAIQNISGYEFLIAQRDPYHFSRNMNSLAKKANGDMILIVNDDVIFDVGSIDKAIECLLTEPKAGLIGGRLRDLNFNRLSHAGIVFDHRNSPYHQLDRLVQADSQTVLGGNKIMPAVTGALMLIRRQDFLRILFDESFKVCGEDVRLCLDIRQELGLEVFYCPSFSGIHEGEGTRKDYEEQQGNSEDLYRLRVLYREFIDNASKEQLLNIINVNRRETSELRSIISLVKDNANKDNISLKEQLSAYENENHSLQLKRISQEAEISRLKKDLARLSAKG